MSYSYKAWLCGNVLEVYQYSNAIAYGYKDKKRKGPRGRSSVASEDDKSINREKVSSRAKKDLTRLINTNYKRGSSRFVTLTFKENMQDLKLANYEFNKFVKRFNYYLMSIYGDDFKLQYSTVVEFQKRGAVHYHSIFYNLPKKLDLGKCRDIWSRGSFNVKRIDRVANVGAYMCKYMSKNADDERLKGNKMYFNSRGLDKPIEIQEPEIVSALVGSLQNQAPVFENEYDISFNDVIQNHVYYKQYIIG